MIEETTSFRLLEVLNIRLSAGTYYQAARNFSAISFRLRGDTVVRCGAETLSASTGDILGIPEGTSYRLERGDEEIIVFHFLMSGEFDRTPFSISGKEELFRPLFEEALEEFKAKKPGYYHRACGIFSKVLEAVFLTVGGGSSGRTDLAKRLFDRNFEDPDCTVASVAKQVGLSPAAFRKSFRQAFGVSPRDYLLQKRLSFARVLLSHKGILRAEVAQRCGFRDDKYFGTLFKEKTGMTFRQYGSCADASARGKKQAVQNMTTHGESVSDRDSIFPETVL